MSGLLRFAFYGRNSTKDFQDRLSSSRWQRDFAGKLIAGRGSIVPASRRQLTPRARRLTRLRVNLVSAITDRPDCVPLGAPCRRFDRFSREWAPACPPHPENES